MDYDGCKPHSKRGNHYVIRAPPILSGQWQWGLATHCCQWQPWGPSNPHFSGRFNGGSHSQSQVTTSSQPYLHLFRSSWSSQSHDNSMTDSQNQQILINRFSDESASIRSQHSILGICCAKNEFTAPILVVGQWWWGPLTSSLVATMPKNCNHGGSGWQQWQWGLGGHNYNNNKLSQPSQHCILSEHHSRFSGGTYLLAASACSQHL